MSPEIAFMTKRDDSSKPEYNYYITEYNYWTMQLSHFSQTPQTLIFILTSIFTSNDSPRNNICIRPRPNVELFMRRIKF